MRFLAVFRENFLRIIWEGSSRKTHLRRLIHEDSSEKIQMKRISMLNRFEQTRCMRRTKLISSLPFDGRTTRK